VHKGWWVVGCRQERRELCLSRLQLVAALFHCAERQGVLEVQVHQLLFLAIDLLDLRLGCVDTGAAVHTQAIGLLREDLAKLGEECRVDEAGAQGVQDTGFQLMATNVETIVAVPFFRVVRQDFAVNSDPPI